MQIFLFIIYISFHILLIKFCLHLLYFMLSYLSVMNFNKIFHHINLFFTLPSFKRYVAYVIVNILKIHNFILLFSFSIRIYVAI